MSRTCGTCGRSWDRGAVFCGVCGDLLGEGLGGASAGQGAGPTPRRRRRVLATALAVTGLGGVLAAVPTLSVERTPPVGGEIGVPDVAALPAAPPGTRLRRAIDPPTITCHRGETELECVQWSRRLAPEADRGGGAGVVRVRDRILVATDERLEAADTTGTRRWGLDLPKPLHPLGTSGGVLVLGAPSAVAAVDLDDGELRWRIDTSSSVWGEVARDHVVYTGADHSTSTAAVVARDPLTGSVRWSWHSTWDDVQVRHVTDDRVVLQPSSSTELVVLDARTGRERTRIDVRRGWVLDVVDEAAIVVAPRAGGTSHAGPDPAGDPGATIEGIDLADGSTRWTRDVRASDVAFEVVAGLVLAPSARRLTAIDAATGAVAWEVDVPGTVALAHHGPLTFWPTAADLPATGVVTFDPVDGRMRRHALDTGAIMWERMLERPVFHAAAQEDVVVAFDPGGAMVLDAVTGEVSVRIDTSGGGLVSRSPYLVHDHETGYVTRLDVTAVDAP